MEDDLRQRAEEWADYLGPDLRSMLPEVRDVQSALRAGEWQWAEEALSGTPFATTSDGLSLRALLADALDDRETLASLAQQIDFSDRPDVKLWSLRESGQTREAIELIRGAIDRFDEDADVLEEGLCSAWIQDDWDLIIALTTRLRHFTLLDADAWLQRGWALEKRGRLPEAVEAYIRSHQEEPRSLIPERLVKILLDNWTEEFETPILRFASEANAEQSEDESMQLLAMVNHFKEYRWIWGTWVTARPLGRSFAGWCVRGLRRVRGRLLGGADAASSLADQAER